MSGWVSPLFLPSSALSAQGLEFSFDDIDFEMHLTISRDGVWGWEVSREETLPSGRPPRSYVLCLYSCINLHLLWQLAEWMPKFQDSWSEDNPQISQIHPEESQDTFSWPPQHLHLLFPFRPCSSSDLTWRADLNSSGPSWPSSFPHNGISVELSKWRNWDDMEAQRRRHSIWRLCENLFWG